jgi:endonuclease/exonuclease/phosphatase family metal-dependent hydrolase
VASFNIHGCRDAQGHFDFDRTARALVGFDLIGLNEVHGDWQWQGPDQAQLLGERLEMPWLFAPTTRRWWRDDFGNGILCRLPVTRWRCVPLAGTRLKGHRNLLLVEIEHPRATIHAVVTHLDRVQDRAAQLRHVIELFLALPEPALLMGDLNTTADDADLSRLLDTPGVHDLVAESLQQAPPPRIDWILGRGLRSLRGGIVETAASDHPLVWAELDLATN